VFATVIALTKDLPDVVGDRQHGIQTFATILGAQRLTALGARFNPQVERQHLSLPLGGHQ
jgi:4-hydroxybenzoate polyprenyltransferase